MKKTIIFLIFLSLFFMKTSKNIIIKPSNDRELPKDGIIWIPKINLKRKFLNSNDVDRNIIIVYKDGYPNTNKSLLVLASHSGTGKYTFFNYLYKLNKDDIAYIIYDNKQYPYVLVNKYIIDKNGKASIYKFKNIKTLVLITCTNNVKGKQTVYVFKEKL